MKKKKFLLLGIASAAFLLAACDNATTQQDTSKNDNTNITTSTINNETTSTINNETTSIIEVDPSVKCQVLFMSPDGTIYETLEVSKGEKVSMPSNPTKASTDNHAYTFENWYSDYRLTKKFDFNSQIVDTTFIYANFTELNVYEVSFVTGTDTSINPVRVIDGNKADKPTIIPTKEQDEQYTYEFDNWYKDSNCTEVFNFEQEKITSSISVYAKYTPTLRKFNVEFDLDGGNEIDALTEIEYGSLINAPSTIPTKPQDTRGTYTFAGWYKDSEYSEVFDFTKDTITADTTIYAKWDIQYGSGFTQAKMPDYSVYEGTDAYVKVSTAEELINALVNARIDYTSSVKEIVEDAGKIVRNNVRKNETNWKNAITKGLYLKNSDGTYTKIPEDTPFDDTSYTAAMTYYEDSPASKVSITQTLNKDATVHVIELTADIDLGYYNLSNEIKNSGIVESYCSKYDSVIAAGTAPFSVSTMLKENGISKINIGNTNNLLVYSKNGAKITHAGFNVTSCDGITFRNIEMDELWQWEDSANSSPTFTIGDMDVFGWAYFKINFCGYIWIDHCTFGKSYDGQIDVANPYFYSMGTAYRAPYGKPETYTEENSSGVQISNCQFLSGSDDEDGYLYKMMEEIEDDYQKSKNDSNYSCKYLYYKTLRDNYNLSFKEILYGIAIPQKKAFLLGDSSESKKIDTYYYNQTLRVSLTDNLFVDIEDRLPNVRGGIAYVSNCVFDNSRYYYYRRLINISGAKGISNVNSKYKLAAVSQGIIGGYGASIRAENCVFIGIEELVKNNNKASSDDTISSSQYAAGFSIVNCIWYNDEKSEDYSRIINTDTNPTQITATGSSPMTVDNFNWHTSDNTKPFDISSYVDDLHDLKDYLLETAKIGINK